LGNSIPKEYLMTRKSILLGFAAATMMAGPVSAGGNAQSGATVGDCMSDGLYGNEPNVLVGTGGPAEQAPGSQAGNVVPSQSPGPFVNNPTDPDNPTRGRSAGAWNQEGFNIPEICRTITQ
jgi:hypothetical protein